MTDGDDLQQIGNDADDLDGLLGAYVLDALDNDERRRVEEYLAHSPAARAEVDRLTDSFDLVVAEDAPEMTPRAELWDRIAVSLPPRTDRLPQNPERAEPAEPVETPQGTDTTEVADAGGDELGTRRAARARRTTSTTTRIIVSIAAAVIVVLVGLTVVRQSTTRTSSLAAQIQRDADAAANAPGSKTFTLTGESDASVKVVVDASGRGFVSPDGLPALDEGSTYQLWSVDNGTPVSLGILGSDPGLTVVATGPDLSSMAITAEPAGGSPAPTSSILVSGTLT